MFTLPRIDDVTLRCPRLPPCFDGLQILHLSDLHVTNWTRRLTQWQDLIKQTTPDLVAITGDLGHRSWMWKKALPTLQRFLAPLHPPLGMFFILGNHDSGKLGQAFVGPMRERLDNQSVRFACDGAELALIGLNQHRRIDTDIPAALDGVAPGDFKLMLLHYPDLIHAAVSAGVDVCLAGHTHGGQICYPDGRPIMGHDVLPPEMCTGIHQVRGTWMVVNRGIGVAGIRVRMFCPPQVILLTLRTGAGTSQRRVDVSRIHRVAAAARRAPRNTRGAKRGRGHARYLSNGGHNELNRADKPVRYAHIFLYPRHLWSILHGSTNFFSGIMQPQSHADARTSNSAVWAELMSLDYQYLDG